jgi:hypothetical protein
MNEGFKLSLLRTHVVFVEVQDGLAVLVEAPLVVVGSEGSGVVAAWYLPLVPPLNVIEALGTVEVGRNVVDPGQPTRK